MGPAIKRVGGARARSGPPGQLPGAGGLLPLGRTGDQTGREESMSDEMNIPATLGQSRR